MFEWIKRVFMKEETTVSNSRQPAFETLFSVSFDDEEIKLRIPDGNERTIEWGKLIGVAIQTTDEGPFLPDVFWLLGTNENSLRIPQGAQGEEKLLHRLQQLPGFNNEQVILAMASAQNNLFICWQKEKEGI
jgi:hypothetical protein